MGDRTTSARLLEWGIAEETGEGVSLATGVSADVVDLFSALVDTYDPVLRQIALKDCPICFCTGLVRLPGPREPISGVGGTTIAAGGQGHSPAGAAISCLGEMAERISLFADGPGDPRIADGAGEFGALSLGPILGFSERQERQFADAYPALQAVLQQERIDWNRLSQRTVEVANLRNGRRALVPAFGVLLGEREATTGAVPSVASSSGAAVWSTREDAARRAMEELAERDAFGRSWYNRLGITRVNRADWDRFLPEISANYLAERARETHLLRIDTDLDVHVLAAVSCLENGFGGCLGVSAARIAPDAAFSAVSEMLQAEISLELSARAHEADRRRGQTRMPPALAVAGSLRLADELGLDGLPPADPGVLERIYGDRDLEQSCHERNIDLWQFDATRADLGIPCIKMLSPHLCSWQPRFGKKRLFAGAEGLDVSDIETLELDFEKRPFPF